ncbi:DBH-like monooxygenase protein 2 [Pseudorca crassidens]|uniref:DBH-like monooxygenase protein 2 n=1 Tax=Pseudorca crassidens TaxID=82174 RepID=UPI00352C9F04
MGITVSLTPLLSPPRAPVPQDPSNVTFLHWDFNLEAEIVTFELQVQTAGWVGLGITNRYTMVGSNLVVGAVSPDGNVYFSCCSWAAAPRCPQSDTVRVLATYGPDDTLKLDRERTFFFIPEDDTTYACTFLPLSIVSKKHHIYKFEPKLVHHKETTVHHILVYRLRQHQCSAQGHQRLLQGRPRLLPLLTGHRGLGCRGHSVYGSSGIRVYYTAQLRKYDMGVLQLGFCTLPIHFVPPGAESFASYGLCKAEQFDEMNGAPVPDIQVCGYLLHTHLAGRTLQAVQYSSMEGMMAMNNVEWTPENIKKAEKACEEAQQMVIIKTIDELVENTTGWIPEIIPAPRGPCLESSRGKVEPQDRTPVGFRAAPMTLSGSSTATPRRLPLTALLFGQGAMSWLLATLQAGA